MQSVPGILKQLARSGLDLVFPLECLGCGASGQLLCPACVAKLPTLELPFCRVCAQPGHQRQCDWCHANPPVIDGIRSPYLMQGNMRELIHRFKYRNLRAAAPELGQLLADYLTTHPMLSQVIVPVPLHPRRLRSRGYNQAALLAHEVGKRTRLPVDEKLLSRRTDAVAQVQTSTRQQRSNNVRGSFACAAEAAGLAVLLIDDVTTTGSTLFECAAVLKRAGASSVWGLVLAKEA